MSRMTTHKATNVPAFARPTMTLSLVQLKYRFEAEIIYDAYVVSIGKRGHNGPNSDKGR